jgi:hypothetical protein
MPGETIDHAATVFAAAVTTLDLECARPAPASEKPDERRAENDDRKWNGEKENANESCRREANHHIVLKRAPADPHNRFQHDCEHCRLETEKQRNDHRHIAVGGIHVAQRHDREDAGDDEQDASNDAAERAVHQPADIGGELLRLRSRQEHAVVERVQESRFRDPALFFDDNAMHHRDLPRGATEAEARHAQPHLHGIPERHAVSWRFTTCCCERQLSHGYRRFFRKNS